VGGGGGGFKDRIDQGYNCASLRPVEDALKLRKPKTHHYITNSLPGITIFHYRPSKANHVAT